MVLTLCLFALIVQVARALLCSENSSLRACPFSDLEDVELHECCLASFIFSNESITLNRSLNFINFDNVTFKGHPTTVKCSPDVGIKFENVSQVVIEAMQFLSCGSWHNYTSSRNEILWIQFAVLVISSRLKVYGSTFANSQGTGLALLNNKMVCIEDCSFTNNSADYKYESGNAGFGGGGGLYIELSCCSDMGNGCNNISYVISSSNFTRNKAQFNHSTDKKGPFYGLGNGGGMELWLCNSRNSDISISGCHYTENNAIWGGGMQIVQSNKSSNNTVSIMDSTFQGNRAVRGGGGLDMGFVGSYVIANRISLNGINFEDNFAASGAGCAIFTALDFQQTSNSFEVKECLWKNNTAHYGAAVTISPYRTDIPNANQTLKFTDCEFVSNRVIEKEVESNVVQKGKGILMVTGNVVIFGNNITFKDNNSTCINAISTVLIFTTNTIALFHNNTARNGAGIFLLGFSIIAVAEHVSLTFCSNFVTNRGSALYYYSIDKNAYAYKQNCFIQKLNPNQSTENVYFNFFGNEALANFSYINNERKSDAIYATTLEACSKSKDDFFQDVGIFRNCDECTQSSTSCNNSLTQEQISVEDGNISLMQSSIEFVPGHLFPLPLVKSIGLYNVAILNGDNSGSNITIPEAFRVVTSTDMRLHGNPGDTATLILTERSFRKYSITLNVTAKDCPPLQKMDDTLSCVCLSTSDVKFAEFHDCSGNSKVRFGYWINYVKKSQSEAANSRDRFNLLTSHCPLGYCNSGRQTNDSNYFILPSTHSPDNLDEVVCNNRQNTLCGHCSNGKTVYYHSESFKCGETNLCHLGPLFFILSEIFPLTLLFLVVIVFNVSFTSGNLNGFIFFAQMYDSISKVGESFITHPYQYSKISLVHNIVYKTFNMDFFDIDVLSFCLFKTHSTLDILLVKYLTIAYALVLVLGTIWLIRVCSKFRILKFRKARYSVIQGLSAFLVMMYSQSTYVSLAILNPIDIYSGTRHYQRVVFYDGTMEYFVGRHFYYVIPALFFLLTFITVLPLLLISYPLCNKVIAFLRLENSPVVKLSSRLFPITKIKPLLDCFQGTFKDNCRFFAGLYFVYRFTILSSRFATGVITIFTIIQIQLIAMLVLHTMFWPYQKKIHNMIDLIIFANLSIINSLKLLNFVYAENGARENSRIHAVHYTQLFFIYIPLFGLCLWILYKFASKIKQLVLSRTPKSITPQPLESHYDGRSIDALDNDDEFLGNDRRTFFGSESYRMVKRNRLELLNS